MSNKITVEAKVVWEGLDWNGQRERRVILTLPHSVSEPGIEHGMDSKTARKIGEMLILAADKADAMQVWDFKT